MTASKLSRETGLSPSYLNYLERGRFGDVGIEKFARLLLALRVSADQVLQEAGYLPAQPSKTPTPEDFLRTRYKLSPAQLVQATDFLEFLARKRSRNLKAEPSKRK